MASARFSNLQDWLSWQETLHSSEIDLGLERVGRVADSLACCSPAPVVVSVAGTNGKGSSVALLEAVYRRAGYRVGVYSSPHLIDYNERIRVDGEPVDEPTICAAFARIDSVRGDSPLTYFEFGTLAALCIFSDENLDVVILEVGLGGRLDAVNIVDADVALITAIGIDHCEWLGNDRDAIAREKAGIMRSGKAAVCADSDPTQSLLAVAQSGGAEFFRLGVDFHVSESGRLWHWQGRASRLRNLPGPALAGAHQLANAAGVLMVVEYLQSRLQVGRGAIEAGLKWVCLPGRIQRLPGAVEQVLDVSHNALAAQALADALRQTPVAGRTFLLLGMMADKDIVAFVQPLLSVADCWYTTGLQTTRAASGEALAGMIAPYVRDKRLQAFSSVAEAAAGLKENVKNGDRILVCGSFHTVAEWSRLKPEFN
jgi:dihydrofolate synthase/folylpolyglutamate synthase